MAIPVLKSISNDDLEHDPYPIYTELREKHPVVYLSQVDCTFVTRWDDVNHILAAPEGLKAGAERDNDFFGTPSVLSAEGEEHTSLRTGIDVELRPRRVSKYIDDLARGLTRDYLEQIIAQGGGNLVSDLLHKISVRAVGTVLGLGDLDDETLVRWFHTLAAGNTDAFATDEGTISESKAVREEIDVYLRNKVDELSTHPDHSMLSHMIHAGMPEGQLRSYDFLRPSMEVIILGGFQEPSAAVSSTLLGLLQNPDQMQQFVEDPIRFSPIALEEGMRWISPIGALQRTPRANVNVNDISIRQGTELELIVASANRDPHHFPDANKFNMHRTPEHLAFGHGRHHCAGHSLARGIGKICLEEIATGLPNLTLDSAKTPSVEGWMFRGVTDLPVTWSTP